MSWHIGVLKNTVRVSNTCGAAIKAYLVSQYTHEPDDVVCLDGTLCFDSHEHSDYLDAEVCALIAADGATGDVCFGSVEGDNAGEFWGHRFEGGSCQKLKGEVVWYVDTRDEELAAIRALLWPSIADQTWCYCIGDEAGEHLQVIDGWTKYRGLNEAQALDVAAAKLHSVGFRAGMTADEACALFKAARENGPAWGLAHTPVRLGLT